jgi:hypothetical protein
VKGHSPARPPLGCGPLMLIGEGTNEIQRLVIARRLLRKYET